MNTTFATVAATNVESFAEVFALVYNAPPWEDGWSVPVAAERLRGLATVERCEALGAYRGGRGVGLALGAGERVAAGWVLHLRELFVAPDARGCGIGRKLLSEFERSLVGRYIGIHLQVGHPAPAHRFYVRSGYAATDLVSMTKRIAA